MVLRVPTVNPRLANITAPQLPRINVLGALQQGRARGDRNRELQQQQELQGVLQAQGPAALGGDVDALNEIRMLGEDGFNMASQIQQVLDSQDSKKVLEAQKKIEKHGLFLASILKLEPPEQKRKLFDESHKLMSAGDRKAATEFLHISQLKDDLDIQGEVESALVIASAGNKYLQGFVPQTGARTGLASAKTEIFKNGIQYRSIFLRRHAYYWSELSGIASSATRITFFGKDIQTIPSGVIYLYTGKSIELTNRFQNIPRLVEIVKSKTYPLIWPTLKSTFRSGSTAQFGRLTLTREHLHIAKKSIPWESVSRLRVESGFLVVELRDNSEQQVPISDIPNLELLLQCVDWGIQI